MMIVAYRASQGWLDGFAKGEQMATATSLFQQIYSNQNKEAANESPHPKKSGTDSNKNNIHSIYHIISKPNTTIALWNNYSLL